MSSASWDAYWQGSKDGAAYGIEGVTHPLVAAYWERFLSSLPDVGPSTRIIDVASGSGAVLESMHKHFEENTPEITSLDVSSAAIARINDKFPDVRGVVADAARVPFEDGVFDIVTSQFGVEYAGVDAIYEIARLVAPGGHLALMLHHRAGSIYQECSDSLEATRRTEDSNFVPYARAMFDAGFRAIRGASRSDYEAAGKDFAPTIPMVEKVIREYGPQVAAGTITQLYEDVGRIHSELQHFEPEEVLAWLDRMQHELEAFAGRMASMTNSALDGGTFQAVCDRLREDGFAIDEAAALTTSADDPPLAWVLTANREADAASIKERRAQFEEWRRLQLDLSVKFVMDKNLLDAEVLEAKPAWSYPLHILISKVRQQGEPGHFVWIISGDTPTDYLSSEAAESPRDAARHFAMKWQLEAGPEAEDKPGLVEQAESLFALVNDESLWR